MTTHTTYDDTCPSCRTNWVTRRWGCWTLQIPYARGLTPICPECRSIDASSHSAGCRFWYGPDAGPRLARFDDLEPYTPDYTRLDEGLMPSRSRLLTRIAIMTVFTAVVAMIAWPMVRHFL